MEITENSVGLDLYACACSLAVIYVYGLTDCNKSLARDRLQQLAEKDPEFKRFLDIMTTDESV